MKYKFVNKTNEPQFINLTDGSSVKVDPKGETILDNWNIYKEEIERSKIFFDVSLELIISAVPVREVQKPKKVYVRKKKVKPVIEKSMEQAEEKTEIEDTNYFNDMEVS